MSDTLDRVKQVAAEVLKIDAESINEADRFAEDLGAESIQSVELVAAFEEAFDVDMDEDQALQVKSVQDAVAFIDSLL